ncbi:MAG: NUDIX domain-containing protein [Magnetococcales bacterium]|nr:NUDIX domain-containing protein [Magnetococcales bacterium]
MLIRPCGICIVGNRLLTMRYTYGSHNRFNLPGGSQEGEEQVVDTLHREFMEELGVNIEVGDLLLTCETLIKNRLTLHLAFQITRIKGTPRCNPTETRAQEVTWLPLEHLGRDILYPAIGPELESAILPDHPHPTHLGRLNQPWFE